MNRNGSATTFFVKARRAARTLTAALGLASTLVIGAAGPASASGPANASEVNCWDGRMNVAVPAVAALRATTPGNIHVVGGGNSQVVSTRVWLYKWNVYQWAPLLSGPVLTTTAYEYATPLDLKSWTNAATKQPENATTFNIHAAGQYKVTQEVWWHANTITPGGYAVLRPTIYYHPTAPGSWFTPVYDHCKYR